MARLGGMALKQWLIAGAAAALLAAVLLPHAKGPEGTPQAGVSFVEPAKATSAGPSFRPVPGTRMAWGAAPAGEPAGVVEAATEANDQACGKVVTAARSTDGTIIGTCASGDRYWVFTEKSVGPVALNCTAAKELLGVDAC